MTKTLTLELELEDTEHEFWGNRSFEDTEQQFKKMFNWKTLSLAGSIKKQSSSK